MTHKGGEHIHQLAAQHGENVTTVSSGNALGSAIPSMILLLPGSVAEMTSLWSMTTEDFVSWLSLSSYYKAADLRLLVLSGATSHLVTLL
jgi:hypothetical protein